MNRSSVTTLALFTLWTVYSLFAYALVRIGEQGIKQVLEALSGL